MERKLAQPVPEPWLKWLHGEYARQIAADDPARAIELAEQIEDEKERKHDSGAHRALLAHPGRGGRGGLARAVSARRSESRAGSQHAACRSTCRASTCPTGSPDDPH